MFCSKWFIQKWELTIWKNLQRQRNLCKLSIKVDKNQTVCGYIQTRSVSIQVNLTRHPAYTVKWFMITQLCIRDQGILVAQLISSTWSVFIGASGFFPSSPLQFQIDRTKCKTLLLWRCLVAWGEMGGEWCVTKCTEGKPCGLCTT